MRSLCGRGFDCTPGAADSLLEFFSSRSQWIVRNVQRTFLYFGFNHAVQSYDSLDHFPFAGGISELLNFQPSDHGFARTQIGAVSFLLHVSKMFVRGAMTPRIRHSIVTVQSVKRPSESLCFMALQFSGR